MISTIFLASPVEQQFKAFDKPLRKLLVKRLRALHSNPRPPDVTTLDSLEHLYRIREGDYRIVYAIRKRDLIVLAVKGRARREDRRTGA